MKNIAGLLDRLEREVDEALEALGSAEYLVQRAGNTGVTLAQDFDVSLARLSIAGELATDYVAIKEMRQRIVTQIAASAAAIREAIES